MHRALWRRAAIALALLALASCRYRPTQVTIQLDGDRDTDRPATVTIATVEGLASYAELTRSLATPAATLSHSAQQPLLGQSFAVVPKSGSPRTAMISMLAVYDAPASEGFSTPLHIERMHQFAFVERVPQQGFIRFSSACAAPSTDCGAGVAQQECTVWRSCIDQGATCGDDGTCVRMELPLTAIPVGTALDASRPFDASARRLDASSDGASEDALDASAEDSDAGALDDVAQDAPTPIVTRLIAPMSASMTTHTRPALRWSAAPDALSMDVELCRNRMMSSMCQTLSAMTAERVRPAVDLESGWWYWRVRTTTMGGAHTTPVWQFRVPARSAPSVDSTCGAHLDFNGDGLSDVVVGAPGNSPGTATIYRNNSTSFVFVTAVVGNAVWQGVGTSVANAGDFNGDGLSDIILGAPGADPDVRTNAGGARVQFGGNLAGTPRAVFGERASDALGRVVDGAGDVNGDGYGDVVVSVPSADSMSAADVGAFVVVYGGRAGVSARAPSMIYASEAGQGFAVSVAGAGDVNGDGFADIVVGANTAASGALASAGFAQVYLGSAMGLTETPEVTWSGQAMGERFGLTVAAAGDVNGDGYCDVLVGSSAATVGGMSDVGLVRVFHGGPTIAMSAATTINGAFGRANFAGSISSAGDVNNDGFADVIVGAQRAAPSGRVEAGSIAIYHGGSLGISPTVITRVDGITAGDHFGRAVNRCGDVNNDGFADVIVGAPNMTAAGSAMVLIGSATGTATTPTPLRTLTGTVASDTFGTSVAMLSVDRARRALCALPHAGTNARHSRFDP